MDLECHYTGIDDPELEIIFRASHQVVHRCFVEFLDQGGKKPHMAFKLDFETPFSYGAGEIQGCRLSMDYYPEEPYEDGGAIMVKLLSYERSTLSTFGTFEFPVLAKKTLRDWVYTLRPLETFEFVQINARDLDGCRDWMSQAMIALHRQGIVSWHWVKQDLPEYRISGLEQAYEDRRFDVLIGYKFSKDCADMVHAAFLPICPGIFYDFHRQTEHQGRQLPYRAA